MRGRIGAASVPEGPFRNAEEEERGTRGNGHAEGLPTPLFSEESPGEITPTNIGILRRGGRAKEKPTRGGDCTRTRLRPKEQKKTGGADLGRY